MNHLPASMNPLSKRCTGILVLLPKQITPLSASNMFMRPTNAPKKSLQCPRATPSQGAVLSPSFSTVNITTVNGGNGGKNVNGMHVPDRCSPILDTFEPKDNSTPLSAVSKRHWEASWTPEEVKEGVANHSMATWTPGNAIKGAPMMVRGEGVYLYDMDGKQYIDLTSQVAQRLWVGG